MEISPVRQVDPDLCKGCPYLQLNVLSKPRENDPKGLVWTCVVWTLIASGLNNTTINNDTPDTCPLKGMFGVD